jgi:NAD(P)-dependent dehydrogenase (short-subunit alcohol dehydrogenase family)
MKAFGAAPHVLITGASGAIGGALARSIAARCAGARLTLVDRAEIEAKALAAELPCQSAVVAADLSDIDAVPGVLAQARAAHGPIDGLINAAGIMEVTRIESLAWEQAWRLLIVDLVTPLRLMQACSICCRARRCRRQRTSIWDAFGSGCALRCRRAGLSYCLRGAGAERNGCHGVSGTSSVWSAAHEPNTATANGLCGADRPTGCSGRTHCDGHWMHVWYSLPSTRWGFRRRRLPRGWPWLSDQTRTADGVSANCGWVGT